MIKIIRENQNPQTQTPEFKRWFGNSKVVDDRGNPLVVYHGTSSKFDSFQSHAYFTPDRDQAKGYGKARGDGKGIVISAYLSIQKPAYPDDVEKALKAVGEYSDYETVAEQAENSKALAYLKSKGFDGVMGIWDFGFISDFDEFEAMIAFYPNQIKSATDNNGEFDPRSNNIYEQRFNESKENDLMRIRDYYEGTGMDVDIFTSSSKAYANRATLSRLYVPKDLRGKGYAKEAMSALTDWADRYGVTLLLTPTNEWGASKARLIQFYKRFGFVENKGSKKNYQYRETMYRKPETD